MNRIVLLTLAISAAIATASTPKIPGQSDCGLNEIFRECSTMCEEKCGDYILETRACAAACGPPKCQCDGGFYRNSTGACITRPECEKQARPRRDADSGPPPPPTCENFECPAGQKCTLPPMECPVPPCTRRPACVRDPDYLPGDEIVPTCEGHQCPAGQKCQLKEVQCIRAPCHPIPDCVPDTVPPTCTLTCPHGETCVLETVLCKKAPCPPRPSCKPQNKTCAKKNETWSECFTGCERTCKTRFKACTRQCGPGGCQCDSGYIRDEKNGECVLESDCPNTCVANEVYDTCFHGCEATCTQPNPACTEQCGPGGCKCADGLMRDPVTKLCIKKSACRI